MKFVCDVMLGKLARWLRLLGYDTFYDASTEDDALIKKAAKAKAVLLTRDKRLAPKAKDFCRVVLLKTNDLSSQLKTVVRGLHLRASIKQTLCPMCGAKLRKVPKKSVKEKVWLRVYLRHKAFWRCFKCRQIYWQGTHVSQITKTLKQLSSKA